MGRLFVMALTIFIAELGDKTHIPTPHLASECENAPLAVFAASAFALVFASAAAVAIGTLARLAANDAPEADCRYRLRGDRHLVHWSLFSRHVSAAPRFYGESACSRVIS